MFMGSPLSGAAVMGGTEGRQGLGREKRELEWPDCPGLEGLCGPPTPPKLSSHDCRSLGGAAVTGTRSCHLGVAVCRGAGALAGLC